MSEQAQRHSIDAPVPVALSRWLPSWPWIVGLLAMLRALASPLACCICTVAFCSALRWLAFSLARLHSTPVNGWRAFRRSGAGHHRRGADQPQRYRSACPTVPADGDAGLADRLWEWMPANVAEFPALQAWLLDLLALGLLASVRLFWTRTVLLVGLVYAALAHVRHADLLGLIGPLVMAAGFGTALADWTRPAAALPLLRGAALLARPASLPGRVVALVLAIAISAPVLALPIDRSGDAVTSQAALVAAQRLGLTGPVFNSEPFGGYLIFSGVPTLSTAVLSFMATIFSPRTSPRSAAT